MTHCIIQSSSVSSQPALLTNHLLTRCQRKTGLYWGYGEHPEPVFKAPFRPEATLSTGTELVAQEEWRCGQEFNTHPEPSHRLSLWLAARKKRGGGCVTESEVLCVCVCVWGRRRHICTAKSRCWGSSAPVWACVCLAKCCCVKETAIIVTPATAFVISL